IEPRRTYRGTTTTLDRGDVVVLYTDGVTEAVGEREAFFQADGLLRAIGQATGGPERVGDAVLRALRAHVGSRCQSDDIAVVCFGRD
ncbi:MAG: serine/threonine-protein phosphatase, partial [Thermoleophilia bacterium]|nr:serine/threonine-protein phosphatase [Thermoleophilia bacterium]